MATVAGPPVTMSNVRSVFGAPAGTALHAFVRGGSWVPNIPANANVPTSVPITLHQLAGATNYVPVAVNVSPSPSSTTRSANLASGPVTSNTVTATATNGTGGPYTYSWTYVSGSTNMQCNATTSATTSFSTITNISNTITTVWKVTASDGTSTGFYNETVNLTYTSNQ